MLRRTFISTAMLSCSMLASAQDYPSRPVIMIVPAAPGGGTDILGRVLAEELGKRLKQTVVVDNKAGASGMLGAQAVARAAPDGYTLLFAYSAPIYYARHMFSKMPYDVARDLAVVSEVAANNLILVVNNDVPAKDMKQFMAWALWGMGTLAPMLPYIQSGKVRPIAVLADKRLPALPDVPTVKEAGFSDPQLRSMSWFTLSAPARTPQPILNLLEKHAREIAQSTTMKARMQVLGLDPLGSSAKDFLRNYEATGPVIEQLVKISGARTE